LRGLTGLNRFALTGEECGVHRRRLPAVAAAIASIV
jgi:hypothetical protein